MKKAALSLILISLVATWAQADAAQAVGYWKSISDVKGEEGKVTALWKLSLDGQGQLQGMIVAVPGKPGTEKYVSQKKEYNGLPVVGTYWMKGLKKAGNEGWNNGTIVDIGDAKADVYGCEVKVVENGKKLAMRGYIGFALIGRTQNWVSATAEEAKAMIGK